ncbi:MAG: hypothetical protein WBG90_13820 [Saonia sp.]
MEKKGLLLAENDGLLDTLGQSLLHAEVYGEEVVNISLKKSMEDIIQEFDGFPETESIADELIDFDFLPLVIATPQESDTVVLEERPDRIIDRTIHAASISEATNNDTAYSYSQSVFKPLYFDNDYYNRVLLLDTIGDVGDKREIPLLKEIIVKEENTAIRTSALDILNEISGKNYRFITEEAAIVENKDFMDSSIFKRLFCGRDTSVKLMLLDEIGTLGDTRELAFLNTLVNHSDKKIRDKARKVKVLLEKRCEEEVIKNTTTLSEKINGPQDETVYSNENRPQDSFFDNLFPLRVKIVHMFNYVLNLML